MKKAWLILLVFTLLLSLSACGNSENTDTAADTSQAEQSSSEEEPTVSTEETEELTGNTQQMEETDMNETSILIAYFSRTGENYGVGYIEKGNTNIIADMIAEQTGGDLFEIRTENPYPDAYDECTEVARQEQRENARPELVEMIEDIDQYDVVFLGYPNWWGDMPMAVYTFLESYDFSGKR